MPDCEGSQAWTGPWGRDLAEIQRRREAAIKLGDAERVRRQHERGHLTARERIDELVDDGTFREVGTLAGRADYAHDGTPKLNPATYILGTARVARRPVVVGAQDFSRRGGTGDRVAHDKKRYADVMAADLLLPLVRLIDGGGGSVRSVLDIGRTYVPGDVFWKTAVDNLGRVPVVSACLGIAAGIDAALVACSHFSIMTKNDSSVFAAGPPVVKAAFGMDATKEELGGATVHGQSGVVDNIADNEEDAIEQVRRFLSYLPTNAWGLPPRDDPRSAPVGSEDDLDGLIPFDRRKPYDARVLLDSVFDEGSIFELGRHFGASAVTALGRIEGYPVGILAFDPYRDAGAMTSAAADKLVRLLDLCETFHLPVVRFIDQPGVAIGPDAELSGAIRHSARLIAATYQGKTPCVNVIVRRCFGIAGGALNRMTGMHLRYAWPSARWGSIPVEGGVEAAYKREIEAAENPLAMRDEYVRQVEEIASPFRTAEDFGVEEVIAPNETRSVLIDWLDLAWRKQEAQPVQPFAHSIRP